MSTVDRASEDYLVALDVERGLSPNTVEAYRRDLDQYSTFLADRQPAPALVEEFVGTLIELGLAPASVARKLSAIRGLHRFLVAEGLSDSDPTVGIDLPRIPSRLPKALTIAQMLALMERPSSDIPGGRRDRALLEFLYATGARVSETTSLDVTDVDLDERTAIVTGKGDKQRLVPLGQHAVAAVQAWLPDRLSISKPGIDSGAMFLNLRGGRLTRQGIWGIVRSHGRSVTLEVDVSPHVVRHSTATHLVEGGADLRVVQEILGHANINTTQVYTRVSPQHLLEVYVASHPRSTGS